MNRIFLIASLLALAGCAQVPRMPVDVAVVPDDCANRQAIVRWLETVNQTPRGAFQSERDYQHNQMVIKSRIWRMRYNCQRMQ